MANKRKKEVLRMFLLKNPLILVAVLVIFSVGIVLVSKNQASKTQDSMITGYATATNPEQPSAVSASAALAPETDISVWQGQFFEGTEFQIGTYEFNFTVYDDKAGGGMLF